MPTISRTSPAANVRLPHQSILPGLRTPSSRSERYDQIVAKSPIGTEMTKTSRHSTGARRPPSTSPKNEPTTIETLLMPSASPRSSCGKASVRIALEFAKTIAAPTPCPTRIPISQSAAALPCSHVTESRIEKKVKTAKPRRNIRTRPYMSPSRPRLTSSTAITTRKPSSSQSR